MIRAQTGVKSAAMGDGPRDDDGSPGKTANLVRLMTLFAAVAIAFVPRLARATTKKLDLPYVTIDHPQFVLASQATFLSPDDMLIGVTDGKTAKAYPAAILAQHGVVQDQMADGPIAVTW
jgi:Protein of unknown function (DUF3179)